MPYPDDILIAGERVVVHEHPHWKMLLGPVLALVVIVVLLGVGGVAFGGSWGPTGQLVLLALGVLLVGWLVVLPVINWRTTHFVVTNRRVLMRTGWITTRGTDIPIRRINTVQFEHSILERFLGCGTLVVESASDEALAFRDVPDVERVYAVLYREVADEER